MRESMMRDVYMFRGGSSEFCGAIARTDYHAQVYPGPKDVASCIRRIAGIIWKAYISPQRIAVAKKHPRGVIVWVTQINKGIKVQELLSQEFSTLFMAKKVRDKTRADASAKKTASDNHPKNKNTTKQSTQTTTTTTTTRTKTPKRKDSNQNVDGDDSSDEVELEPNKDIPNVQRIDGKAGDMLKPAFVREILDGHVHVLVATQTFKEGINRLFDFSFTVSPDHLADQVQREGRICRNDTQKHPGVLSPSRAISFINPEMQQSTYLHALWSQAESCKIFELMGDVPERTAAMKKFHEEDLNAISLTHAYLNNHTVCRAVLIHRHFEPTGMDEPAPCKLCDNCTDHNTHNDDDRSWVKFVPSNTQQQHIAQVLTDLSSQEAGENPTFNTIVNNIKSCPLTRGDEQITTVISEWIVDTLISSKVLSVHLHVKMFRNGDAKQGQTKIRTLGTGNTAMHLRPGDCELHYTFNRNSMLSFRTVPPVTTSTPTTEPSAALFVFKESWDRCFWIGRLKKPWNV